MVAACCCMVATCTSRIVSETTRHIGDVTYHGAGIFCKPACALYKLSQKICETVDTLHNSDAATAPS